MSFHLQLWHIDLIGDSHDETHPRHGATGGGVSVLKS